QAPRVGVIWHAACRWRHAPGEHELASKQVRIPNFSTTAFVEVLTDECQDSRIALDCGRAAVVVSFAVSRRGSRAREATDLRQHRARRSRAHTVWDERCLHCPAWTTSHHRVCLGFYARQEHDSNGHGSIARGKRSPARTAGRRRLPYVRGHPGLDDLRAKRRRHRLFVLHAIQNDVESWSYFSIR